MNSADDLLDLFRIQATIDGDTTIQTTFKSDRGKGLRRVKTEVRWTKRKKIGEGGSGEVWLEEEEGNPDTKRAVKEITKDADAPVKVNYLKELLALAKLSKVCPITCTMHNIFLLRESKIGFRIVRLFGRSGVRTLG